MKKMPNLFLAMYTKNVEKDEEVDAVINYLSDLYNTFRLTYNELIKKTPILLQSSKSIHYRSVVGFGCEVAPNYGDTWADGEFIYLGTETSYGDGSTDTGEHLKLKISNIFRVSDTQAKDYVMYLARSVFSERMEIAEKRIAAEHEEYKKRSVAAQQHKLEEARKLLEQNGYKVVGDNK